MTTKTMIAVALTLLAMSAAAQGQRRAPLGNVDELEPAVDVSEPRVAIAQGPATPAAPAPAPAAAPTSPTPAAAPPPAPTPAGPSPQAAERPAPRVMDTLDL